MPASVWLVVSADYLSVYAWLCVSVSMCECKYLCVCMGRTGLSGYEFTGNKLPTHNVGGPLTSR